MNTMEIIHKLHELAEYVEFYKSKIIVMPSIDLNTVDFSSNGGKREFEERVKKIANELIELLEIDEYDKKIYHKYTKERDVMYRDLSFNHLFEKVLESKRYEYLRAICLKIGMEI